MKKRTQVQMIKACIRRLKETDINLGHYEIILDRNSEGFQLYSNNSNCLLCPEAITHIQRAFGLSSYCGYDSERMKVYMRIF